MRLSKRFYSLLLFLVLLSNLLITPWAWAEEAALPEIRSLLQNSYVDPVPEDVLNAPSIDEMLKKLGDPYTSFFTAQEYQEFINAVNGNFEGIGIYIDVVPQGILINGIIEGSPAQESGLLAGDIIVQAGGHDLAGKTTEEAIPFIRGPANTTVELVILRNDNTFSVLVNRRKIEIPTLTYKMLPGQLAYLNVDSFGADTAALFGQAINELQPQGASAYIIDLRNNGGGYVSIAQDIAGYFIGNQTVMQTRSRDAYGQAPAIAHKPLIDKPIIILINKNTASASEILSGALKDYDKAVFLGSRSYGKGCMQTLIRLQTGDYFKMTIAEFYSPLGNTIQKTGISPDMKIEANDPLLTAELLFSANESSDPDASLLSLNIGTHNFITDLAAARQTKYWPIYQGILAQLSAQPLIKSKNVPWQEINAAQLADKWPLYFPGYDFKGSIHKAVSNPVFTIRFSKDFNTNTLNENSIELINSENGARIPVNLQFISNTVLEVSPAQQLSPGITYWLVVNPSVTDLAGQNLQRGAIAQVFVDL